MSESKSVKRARNGAKLEQVEIELELCGAGNQTCVVVTRFIDLHAFIIFEGFTYQFAYVMNGRIQYQRISPVEIDVIEVEGWGE